MNKNSYKNISQSGQQHLDEDERDSIAMKLSQHIPFIVESIIQREIVKSTSPKVREDV